MRTVFSLAKSVAGLIHNWHVVRLIAETVRVDENDAIPSAARSAS